MRHGAALVDRVADDVEDAPERAGAHGDGDARARVHDLGAAHQAVRHVHGDGADGALAKMLRHFEDQGAVLDLHGQRVEDGGQVLRELHVHDRAEDLGDLADVVLHGLSMLLRPPRHRR